jgi:hypothetical protein
MKHFFAFALMIAFAVMVGCGTDRTAQPPTKPVKKPDLAKVQPQPEPTVSGGPTIGEEAPEIVGVDLDGVEFKLSDYRGKVVMLDFYGDW